MGFPEFKIINDAVTGQDRIILSNGQTVTVYNLKNTPFKADPDRLVLYGSDRTLMIAFDTEYTPELIDEISAAMHYYAKHHLSNPRMELSIKDPRPIYN